MTERERLPTPPDHPALPCRACRPHAHTAGRTRQSAFAPPSYRHTSPNKHTPQAHTTHLSPWPELDANRPLLAPDGHGALEFHDAIQLPPYQQATLIHTYVTYSLVCYGLQRHAASCNVAFSLQRVLPACIVSATLQCDMRYIRCMALHRTMVSEPRTVNGCITEVCSKYP
jgi:hypothetical protein